MAGVSHTPTLFSFTSSAPALPTPKTVSGSQVQASSVAHGKAVVVTPVQGWKRSPAGPSAVITDGMPSLKFLPKPKVLAGPILGCPPRSHARSSSVISFMKSSRETFPSATSERRMPFSSRSNSFTGAEGRTAGATGHSSSSVIGVRALLLMVRGSVPIGSCSKVPSLFSLLGSMVGAMRFSRVQTVLSSSRVRAN